MKNPNIAAISTPPGKGGVAIIRISGGDPAGKIHRLLDYTARPGDVADPWYTGDFSATWRDVAEGCRGLLKAITSQAM